MYGKLLSWDQITQAMLFQGVILMMIHMVSLSGTRLTSIFEVFDVNV